MNHYIGEVMSKLPPGAWYDRMTDKWTLPDGSEWLENFGSDTFRCMIPTLFVVAQSITPLRGLDRATGHDYDTHIGALTEEVFNWAEAAFPNRTDQAMYLKLYSEIGEMIDSDGDHLEIADMFILLLDYAKRKKVDVTAAVREKLEINKQRTWKADNNGVMSHVK